MPWAQIPADWRGFMATDARIRPSGALLLFAREPVPGQVKTRLIPALGAEGAARLYHAMLEIALEAAAAVPGVHRELWCSGAPPTDGICAGLALGRGMAVHRQPAGDLGARMGLALSRALGRTDRAVLIGSDCPGYHACYLIAALDALTDHDAVLGPAADGGYVLIGLRRYAPELFTQMPWGTDGVLAQTRAVLDRLGWTWAELPALTDLDRPEDLAQFPALMASLAPQTYLE